MPGRRALRRAFSRAQPLVIQTVFAVLGRAAQSASKHDRDIQDDISGWPEGFTVMFKVLPEGPRVALVKRGDHLEMAGFREVDADLAVLIKNVPSAFQVFTAQMGTPQAYCEHRAFLKGNISDGIQLIRALSNVQCYLFPKIIAQGVVKEVPPLTLERLARRVWIYTLGVPFGL